MKNNKKYIRPISMLLLLGALILFYFLQKPRFKEIGINYPGSVVVNVVRVINPRFTELSDSQFDKTLDLLKENIKTHLGISVVFKMHPTMSMNHFFDRSETKLGNQTEDLRYFIQKNRLFSDQDPNILAQALINEYSDGKHKYSLTKLIEFAKEASSINEKTLFEGKGNLKSLMVEVSSLHFQYYKEIERIVHRDGKLLINTNDNFNEYLYWAKNLTAFPEYDFIITNQLIASIEKTSPSISTSLRGGITIGFAGSTYSQYGSTVVVSTFPFLYKQKFFKEKRGENYLQDNIPEYISALGSHEFGHTLAYWSHDYDHPGCIMRPVAGLQFETWISQINSGDPCKGVYSQVLRNNYLLKKQ